MADVKPTAEPEADASERRRGWREGAPSWWLWIRTPVLFFAGVFAVVVSISAMWGVNLILTIEESTHTIRKEQTKDLTDPWDFSKHPRNVLLLGSDSRAGLSEEEQAKFGTEETVGGQRSDTIILMSIDPRREQAVVVHFPRDLRVMIPGYGYDKINAAYSYGGPNLVIRTVKAFTGLPIHNYMEIDLAGFEHLVDTLGGVRICVDRPMYDELAGLAIPEAGCYTMDGQDALAFVRARHVEGDQIPDFSRIRRQQQFMRAMMNRLFAIDSLLNDTVIREAVGTVKVDSSLRATELIELGRRLRELAEEDPTGAESLDLRVVPGTTETIGDVSYVLAEQPEAEELFERLEAGRPLGQLGQDLALTLPTPAIIKVRVLPAGAADASEVEAMLRRAGFILLEGEPAPATSDGSEILFKAGARSRAQVLKGYFPRLEVREVPSDLLGEAEVALVVGDDFDELTAEADAEEPEA